MPSAKALKKSKRGVLEPLETATSLHKIFTSFTIFIVFQCSHRRHVLMLFVTVGGKKIPCVVGATQGEIFDRWLGGFYHRT